MTLRVYSPINRVISIFLFHVTVLPFLTSNSYHLLKIEAKCNFSGGTYFQSLLSFSIIPILLVVGHLSNHFLSFPFRNERKVSQFSLPYCFTLILFIRLKDILFFVLNSFLLSILAQVLLSYNFNCSLYTSWNLECNFLCLIIFLSTHTLLLKP